MATNLMELSQAVTNTSEFRDHLHMILFDPQKNHPINQMADLYSSLKWGRCLGVKANSSKWQGTDLNSDCVPSQSVSGPRQPTITRQGIF